MAARQASESRGTHDDDNSVRQRILSAAFGAFMERGYADTSTREIATRAHVSKRELYALVGNKQRMLTACISARAQRLKAPAGLPEPRDRESLAQGLTAFGVRLVSEVSDPVVIAVFRLAIAEAVRAPEVAQILDSAARKITRAALTDIMTKARSARLLGGDPVKMTEQFAGLLWGDLILGLLLRVIARPSASEIARRARDATAAFLNLYPEPEGARPRKPLARKKSPEGSSAPLLSPIYTAHFRMEKPG
ncbi:MAG TPA: TetR/AcrR family transcriptional regulator [bacterium]|nr:TetR/AcrR family transcriptional regulator [bacterium]